MNKIERNRCNKQLMFHTILKVSRRNSNKVLSFLFLKMKVAFILVENTSDLQIYKKYII